MIKREVTEMDGNSLTPKKIISSLKEHKEDLQEYGVKKIGLFGSYLKGTQKRGSDLDFLVVLENPTFDNYMELKFFLGRLFRKKVDLITEEGLKPSLRYVKEEAVYA